MIQLQLLLVALTSLVSLLQAQATELPAFDVWLQDLAQCESQNNPNAVNPHDPVTRSRGLYQFKDKTWLQWTKRFNFYPDTWTDKQILEEIFDGHAQTVLVREMIREDYNNYKKWGCVVSGKVDKPPQSF